MPTECGTSQLEFQGARGKRVEARFDAGRTSSDGGLLLLRELEKRRGIVARFARCFTDHRRPELIEHSVEELLLQRVLGIVVGYEDLNDHDKLRDDPLLAIASGKADPLGEGRRARDRGHGLAGKSTLNRLELTPADANAQSRYKKVVYDGAAIDRFFVDVFLDSHGEQPTEIILDLDATDDPIHGSQEGRFFHGYYGHYCYLPLYIFSGPHLLLARLRRADIDACSGALEEVERIVGHIRQRWPDVKIVLRADSGFARDDLMTWCEANAVHFIFGLARNKRLEGMLADDMAAVRIEQASSGKPTRRFKELRYQTIDSWTRERRVVGKAEQLVGKANPRFVVTSLAESEWATRALYEDLYCARGDMENRIKEQQLDMFADRTSTGTMRANQLRLWFSSLAYVLATELRRLGLKDTELEKAQCGTIRNRLLKVAAIVTISVRRVYVSLSSVFPFQQLFAKILKRLQGVTAMT